MLTDDAADSMPVELLIAINPDQDSRLRYLLRVPLASGDLVFRTSGTWPRTKALSCYPGPLDEWPADAVIVERVGLRSCRRRGAAIDVILDRARENRSQLVFTTTTRGRAAGIPDLQIVIDSHEQYPYQFASQQVRTVKRALPCGRLRAGPRRRPGRVRGTQVLGRSGRQPHRRITALPGRRARRPAPGRARVEDRYSQLFKLDHVRPAVIADAVDE